MGSQQGLMDFAQGGDLLALEEAAAAAQVGLENRRRAGPEHRGELAHPGETFSGGYRDGGPSGHPGHALEVLGWHGLLEPERVVGL